MTDNIRKKTSMQDIATALGISKNAVSLAFNNKRGVSEQLREKVIKTAIEMNYGGYGKLGATFESKLVTICFPSAIGRTSQFYSTIYSSIEQELSKHGYRSLIFSLSPEMESAFQLPYGLEEGKIQAVILVGILSKEYVQKVSSLCRNVILVDNYFLDLPVNSVITANLEGGYMETQYLITHGHTRIGFAGKIHTYLAYRQRYIGFTLAMHDAGLAVDPSLLLIHDQLFDFQDQLDQAIAGFSPKMPHALVCANDRAAIQLIGRLHFAGFRIPEDISVIGFDDIETADVITPPLTTMRVPRTEMGRKAALLLIRHLEGEEHPASSVVIYPTLIERNSVKLG